MGLENIFVFFFMLLAAVGYVFSGLYFGKATKTTIIIITD